MRLKVTDAAGCCPWCVGYLRVGFLRIDVDRTNGQEGMHVSVTEDVTEAAADGTIGRVLLGTGEDGTAPEAMGMAQVVGEAGREIQGLIRAAELGGQDGERAKSMLATVDRLVRRGQRGHEVRIVAPGMVRVLLVSESGARVDVQQDMSPESAMEFAQALLEAAAAAVRVRRFARESAARKA
jgi:hypothetical protein